MPKVRTNQRSFVGGEVSGEFYGRVDHVKYVTGLSVCRNFLPLPHGPALNRPGTKYVNACRYAAKKARLIPFTYSSTQTMVIELGDGYARFHTQGGTLLANATAWNSASAYTVGDPVSLSGVNYYCVADHTNHSPPNATYWFPMSGAFYEMKLPYLEADLFKIRYVQSADVLTLTHEGYPVAEIRRYGATKWVYSVVSFGATVSAPSGVSAVATPATTSPGDPDTQSYVVTALGSDGAETVASSPAAGVSYTVSSTSPGSGTVTLTGIAATKWSSGDPVRLTFTDHVGDGDYIVAAVAGTTDSTLTLHTSGGGLATGISSGGGTIIQMGVRNNLYDDSSYNTVTWAPVTGAVRYYIYRLSQGLYGLVGQTTDTVFKDAGGPPVAPDISKTPPTTVNPFSGAGNYPRAVSYYEQRRSFAGTTNKPQNFWLTKSATESNLNQSVPTRDDDAISYRIAAQKVNTIQHLVPLQALVMLTTSAMWRITSVNTDALTPSSTSVKQQSSVGANDVQPVLANENMIYVANRGGHLREVSYKWESSGYVSGDLSRFNPNLFDGKDIVDMAFAEAPYPVLWCPSSDGTLISLTYVPEEQVTGIARHDTTAGAFESVACVAEGSEDAVYFIVRRTIGGATVRYVERMQSRKFSELAQAFIVDCGAQYSGAAISTLSSGLDHLEGMTVNILANGAVHPQRTVTDGAITLDHPASTISVGLPIVSDIQTLPVVLEIDGLGQGRAKNINKAWLRVNESSGIFAGPSFETLTQAKQRTVEPYGTPPNLLTEEIDITLFGNWTDGAQICLRQTDPLPITLVSLTTEVSIGG